MDERDPGVRLALTLTDVVIIESALMFMLGTFPRNDDPALDEFMERAADLQHELERGMAASARAMAR
jgi:hypothetical protein